MPTYMMVGGPLDGHVEDLPGHDVHVALVSAPAQPGPPSTATDAMPKTVTYERVRVNLFGVLLDIYVAADTSPYERDRVAAQWLLSDLCRALARRQGLGHAKPQAAG